MSGPGVLAGLTMPWWLAVFLVAGSLALLVMVWAALVAASRADDLAERAIDYDSPEWHDGYQTGHAEASVFELDGSYRGRAEEPADPTTKER